MHQDLLGMIRVQDEDDWVVFGDARTVLVSPSSARPSRPPAWPDPDSRLQMHLAFRVEDLDQAEGAVLAAGARQLAGGGDSFRVCADPAGHPFCLVLMRGAWLRGRLLPRDKALTLASANRHGRSSSRVIPPRQQRPGKRLRR
jgi:hypothetical protein